MAVVFAAWRHQRTHGTNSLTAPACSGLHGGEDGRGLQALRISSTLSKAGAYRIETVINKPADLGVLAGLEHLPEPRRQGLGHHHAR